MSKRHRATASTPGNICAYCGADVEGAVETCCGASFCAECLEPHADRDHDKVGVTGPAIAAALAAAEQRVAALTEALAARCDGCASEHPPLIRYGEDGHDYGGGFWQACDLRASERAALRATPGGEPS